MAGPMGGMTLRPQTRPHAGHTTTSIIHLLPSTPHRCVSAVQLVYLFQVLLIALVQAAVLRHKLPWTLWVAAAVMIGGASSERPGRAARVWRQPALLLFEPHSAHIPTPFPALPCPAVVLVPSMNQSTSGSLNSAEGWLGFGLAVMALSGGVAFLVLTQASGCRAAVWGLVAAR